MEYYSTDLQYAKERAPENTDIVFMGDINARLGSAQTAEEEQTLGKYGEKKKRDKHGENAYHFLMENDLTSLNSRHATKTGLWSSRPIRVSGIGTAL